MTVTFDQHAPESMESRDIAIAHMRKQRWMSGSYPVIDQHLVVDQLLERGFVADRIQVRVGLCGSAKLLRHLDGVPEVIERVTCPAAEALAAGEVEEQHGVLRSGCDKGA